MTIKELRSLSLDFRRLSSNLLNSGMDDADVNLARFFNYINQNQFISALLHDCIDGIEYDFKNCFGVEESGWHELNVPVDESEHIKAMYDYMAFIVNSEKKSVQGEAIGFFHSSKKWKDIIDNFLSLAFKPLIDYINDSISKEMIICEEEKGSVQMIQNIETVNGVAMQNAESATVTNTTICDSEKIVELIETISKQLAQSNVPDNIKEDINDDLEVVKEQLESSKPKKARLHKAVENLKDFVNEFVIQTGAAVAAGAIMATDWNAVISQIEQIIARL